MTSLVAASLALFAASANVLARTDAALTLAKPGFKAIIDLGALVLSFAALIAAVVGSGWLAGLVVFFAGGMLGGLASSLFRRQPFVVWLVIGAVAIVWFVFECVGRFGG